MFTLGAAYYPDYIPDRSMCRTVSGEVKLVSWRDHVRHDFERMRNCCIDTVRMGEFSWASVEAKRGEFDFSRFEHALKLAGEFGVKTILCTPTATPPKWLIDEHPEILPVTRDERKIPFGSRRHYDFNNDVYREESTRITRAYAEHLGQYDSVIGWQLDNEFGCHNSVFLFTEAAKAKFQIWLKKKYLKIENLNEAWFTPFWSQQYGSFQEIDLPFSSWADQNPHMELDFRIFSNGQLAEFQAEQIRVIRELSPERFTTHNFMSQFTDLCPWRLSEDLDMAGFDHYQMNSSPEPTTSYWQFALMYSLKRKPFQVLEQQPLQVNWQPVNRRFEYPWLFAWTMQSAFSGANGLFYFSYQKFSGGAEQYHDGIVPHDVRLPESWQERILKSSKRFFQNLAEQFQLVELPTPAARMACVYNSESLWTHEITAQSVLYSTKKIVDVLAALAHSSCMGIEFYSSISQALQSSAQIELLTLPGYAFELTDEERILLKQFLRKGGRVLSLPRTAMKRRDNHMTQKPLRFFDEDGLYLEDYGALMEDERDDVSCGNFEFAGNLWSERIHFLDKWESLAKFKTGLYQGATAVARRKEGTNSGAWIHLATCPPASIDLFSWLLAALNLPHSFQSDLSLQLFPLSCGERKFIGAINFSSLALKLQLPSWRKMLSGVIGAGEELQFRTISSGQSSLEMMPFECALLELQ